MSSLESSEDEIIGHYPFIFKNYINLTKDEHIKVLESRNHPDVRKWMFTDEVIEFNNHMNFIRGLGANANKAYYAAFKEGVFYGAVNITNLNQKPSYGYFSNPVFFEGGNGIQIYYFGLSFLIKKYQLSHVYGEVLQENKAVLRISKKFGFEFKDIGNGVMEACLETLRWKHGFTPEELLTFVTTKKEKF